MDKKKLRELINLFKESGLAKMEITENSAEENYSLKLESGAAAPAYMPAPLPYMQPVQEEKSADEPAEAEIKDYNKYRDIKSPMVGIFYAAPSPEAEPFVKVGSKVKGGYALHHRGDEADERRRGGNGRRNRGNLRGKRLVG